MYSELNVHYAMQCIVNKESDFLSFTVQISYYKPFHRNRTFDNQVP